MVDRRSRERNGSANRSSAWSASSQSGHRSTWSATRGTPSRQGWRRRNLRVLPFPGSWSRPWMDPHCACDLCERGGVVYPPLPPSHRGNRFIIVTHRVIHHGRPLTRVVWHELLGSAKLWRGRTTVLHRNVPKPAESESRRTTQRLGTGWSGCTRPWYTIGVAARTFPSRRSPTSFRTCSTRWRPTSGPSAGRRPATRSAAGSGRSRANKVRDHFRKLGREPGGAGGTEAQLLFARLPDDCSDARRIRRGNDRPGPLRPCLGAACGASSRSAPGKRFG